MRCAHCATPVPDDAVYCHQCGSLVSDAEGQAAVTASMDDSAIRNLTDLLRDDTRGEYEIIRQLGRGGMAVVFLAKEIELHRQVAIKALPPELTFGHGVERFKREARTAAGLDHPNIIPIYRIAGGGRIFWYAMKYLEGRSLEHVLKDVMNMSSEETIELLLPVADALDYAHDQGVIHRDIKPANVMVDPRSRVVVTDFGIAKAFTESTLTASGSVIGTPFYMSPEQGMGRQVSGASDQYSVAVIAYRMLAGQLPFEGGSAIDILHRHCTMPPPPLQVLRPNLPEHVYHAINKGLQKKPEQRFSSVTAFVEGLREPSDEITDADIEVVAVAATPPERSIDRISTELISTPTPRGREQDKTPPASKSRLRRFLYVVGAVLAVTAVGVGAWQLGRWDAGSADTEGQESLAATGAENAAEELGPQAGRAATAESLATAREPAETTIAAPTTPQLAWMSVTGAPAGAVIWIDGQQQRGTEFELSAGTHSVRIVAAGMQTVREDITLAAGERFPFSYAAPPAVAQTTPQRAEPSREQTPTETVSRAPGTLRIGVRPVAAVLFVDGEEREAGRRHVEVLPPGEYVLRFEADGFVPRDTIVVVVSGEVTTIQIELTRRQP